MPVLITSKQLGAKVETSCGVRTRVLSLARPLTGWGALATSPSLTLNLRNGHNESHLKKHLHGNGTVIHGDQRKQVPSAWGEGAEKDVFYFHLEKGFLLCRQEGRHLGQRKPPDQRCQLVNGIRTPVTKNKSGVSYLKWYRQWPPSLGSSPQLHTALSLLHRGRI